MPCTDVTEILSLTLDEQERVVHYALTKRTCGAAVGNPSLLRRWVESRHATDVVAAVPDQVLRVMSPSGATWEFLTVKHLRAIQHGLNVLLGSAEGTPDSVCAVISIEATPRGTRLLAQIHVDLLTKEIEACSGCGNYVPAALPTAGHGDCPH